MKRFEDMKYGVFIHCVAGLTPRADGTVPQLPDEFADGFDVPAFAESVAATGAEYVVLTAWHCRMRPLYPSLVTESIRPGNSCWRDLLGEIIDALAARDIAVVLYTHPRDGHDLQGEERTATGWGEGCAPGREDTPSPDTFDYEAWNGYVLALYRELAERYAGRIVGFYTDGVGPTHGKSPVMGRNFQVVDYTAIRDIMKSANEKLVMIQNYFGYLFSDDIGMPEGFFGYENKVGFAFDRLPAPADCIALCPFGGWMPPVAPRAAAPLKMTAREMAIYTLFAGSAAAAGGVCWACAPYAEGGVWQPRVIETLSETAKLLAPYAPYFAASRPSAAYPTLPGDTLKAKGGYFFAESADGATEYLFVAAGAGEQITLPAPENGAELSAPEVALGDLHIEGFDKTEGGFELRLSGEHGEMPAVIAFRVNAPGPRCRRVNDTDRHIRYEGEWKYRFLKGDDAVPLGCYESDYHVAEQAGASAFLAFEGDRAAVFANLRPENGSARVFIDGVYAGLAAANGEDSARRCVFESRALHGGTHTLYLELCGDGPFELDMIRIDASGAGSQSTVR